MRRGRRGRRRWGRRLQSAAGKRYQYLVVYWLARLTHLESPAQSPVPSSPQHPFPPKEANTKHDPLGPHCRAQRPHDRCQHVAVLVEEEHAEEGEEGGERFRVRDGMERWSARCEKEEASGRQGKRWLSWEESDRQAVA